MIERRSVVDVPLGGATPKPRRAVVLDDEVDGIVVVIAVTGTDREIDRVVVEPESREGKAVRLYKPSFFYAANIAAVPASACSVVAGARCPPELHERLLDLRRRHVPPVPKPSG
jgi:hypothetical protein